MLCTLCTGKVFSVEYPPILIFGQNVKLNRACMNNVQVTREH